MEGIDQQRAMAAPKPMDIAPDVQLASFLSETVEREEHLAGQLREQIGQQQERLRLAERVVAAAQAGLSDLRGSDVVAAGPTVG